MITHHSEHARYQLVPASKRAHVRSPTEEIRIFESCEMQVVYVRYAQQLRVGNGLDGLWVQNGGRQYVLRLEGHHTVRPERGAKQKWRQCEETPCEPHATPSSQLRRPHFFFFSHIPLFSVGRSALSVFRRVS